MKKIIALACLTAIGEFVYSETQHKDACTPPTYKIELHRRGNSVFRPGEKFNYQIKYQFMVAGEATMEVHEGPVIECRHTFEFRSTARSAKYLDSFFKVRDFNSSVVDQASLNSFSFHQNLREGRYRVERTTTIDYVHGKYRFEKLRKGNKSFREGEINLPVTDILRAFFYVRTLPLELGQDYFIPVFSDPTTYQLRVKVYPQFEDVKVAAGKFECIKIQPFVVGDAIFKARDGQMTIWLTSDERRIPVLIRSKVTVGAFDAELLKFDIPPKDMVNEKVPTK